MIPCFRLFFAATLLTTQTLILPPHEEKGLVLDAPAKEQTVVPGQEKAVFVFTVRNVSNEPITINQVRTSCGCTVATLPSKPWTVLPGTGGEIKLTLDLRGKSGTIFKTAVIDTLTGYKNLSVKAMVPMTEALRLENQQLARIDRQEVFRDSCAACHALPAQGKTGQALYAAVCAICHDAKNRATMVPDLRAIKPPLSRDSWKSFIAQGKPSTLMPAFAQRQGGPLTDAQIDSLADYLATAFTAKRLP